MIEYLGVDSSRTWYVVFDKRIPGEFHFWHLFTRKNFDHVWLFTALEKNVLVIKPTPSECLIEEWPCTVGEVIKWLPRVTAIVKHESKYRAFKPYVPRGIVNCVVSVKYILGIKSFVLTPLGLFKKLNQLGGTDGRR